MSEMRVSCSASPTRKQKVWQGLKCTFKWVIAIALVFEGLLLAGIWAKSHSANPITSAVTAAIEGYESQAVRAVNWCKAKKGQPAKPKASETQPTEGVEAPANAEETPSVKPAEEPVETQPAEGVEAQANAEGTPPEITAEEPVETQPTEGVEAPANAEGTLPEIPAEEPAETQPTEGAEAPANAEGTPSENAIEVSQEDWEAFQKWQASQPK